MKKIFLLTMMMVCGTVLLHAQADIVFEKTTHDFGTFTKENGIQSCEFKFKNTGDINLFIHQAFASCGCTVPEFTKEAIAPGDSGVVKVTYNGKTKALGTFKKSITIHSNAKTETVRLYVIGEMTEGKAEENKQPAKEQATKE